MTRILVPVDGSEAAEAALSTAFDLFPDGDVHVLNVLQVTDLPADSTASAAELAASESETVIDSVRGIAADRGREIRTDVTEGHAAKTIIAYAADNDIDHVVIGSTGRTGARRLLLGSVAETVVRRAPCPVTVVRE